MPKLSLPSPAKLEPSFGSNLRKFRIARGLSQQQLVERMRKAVRDGGRGVSQTTVSNWERRADSPPGAFVNAVSKALDVPVFAFFVRLDCDDVSKCLEYIETLKEGVCSDEEGVRTTESAG